MQTPVPPSSDLPIDRPWLLISYQPKLDVVVVQQLLARRFEYYRPMVLRERKIKGTTVVLPASALYPGYMFVRAKDADKPASLSGMIGLVWTYGRGIGHEVIQGHRDEEQENFIRIVTPPADRARVVIGLGDRVRTLDGLIEFVVSEFVGNNRVAALNSFMKGGSRLIVDLSGVEKVGPPPATPSKKKKKGKKGRGA